MLAQLVGNKHPDTFWESFLIILAHGPNKYKLVGYLSYCRQVGSPFCYPPLVRKFSRWISPGGHPFTSNSCPWRSIGSSMYRGSAGPGPGGRTDGREDRGGRADGRAGRRAQRCSLILNDFERQYNNVHRF